MTKRESEQLKKCCGLCGNTNTNDLTLTECCNQWICDDEHTYVLFSFCNEIAAIEITIVTLFVVLIIMRVILVIGKIVRSAEITLKLKCMCTSVQMNTTLRN